MKDMLEEIMDALASAPEISDIQKTGGFKSYERRAELDKALPSITVIPTGPPEQTALGSNDSLAKHFSYQISVESTDRKTCKELQKIVEDILKTKRFYQKPGGLDEYFNETKRYVDARFYEGSSNLYDDY